MQALMKETEARMVAAVDALSRELASIRTGRASASLLDTIRVDYYGTITALNQMASITVPDARTITIQPWEVGQLKAIEKAIVASDLGLTPMNDGKIIRLTLPTLAIRNLRRETNDKLKAMAKDKKVSEDEERRGHEQIQKTTDRFIAKVDELLKKKEGEILTI